MTERIVLIIGAGPAGLTAASELLRCTPFKPVVLEADGCVGGLARTVEYRGNRIDIGGHRFFSKSAWVMRWWRDVLPEAGDPARTAGSVPGSGGPADSVLLQRARLSRIYFLRKYFDYPLSFSLATLRKLGMARSIRIALSYLGARLFPVREARTLEDFFVNRFGRELYSTFFKDYTEKLWGAPCGAISAEWGAQRIRDLSLGAAVKQAWSSMMGRASAGEHVSLIDRFLYPKLGPGQLWEEVARRLADQGGEIHLHEQVVGLRVQGGCVAAVTTQNCRTGAKTTRAAEYVISSMPVKDLVAAMGKAVPEDVARVAGGLPYRDFITVGLLLKRMLRNPQSLSTQANQMPPDNWIYIQEPGVKVGRLQIFNNWSPAMVRDPDTIWVGLEYFCNEGDTLWTSTDDELRALARRELAHIGLIAEADVLDGTVIRMAKAYPAYFGSYADFGKVRAFVDTLENLFLVGRNGMHRYNNQDHSMLTAKLAVECIAGGAADKRKIWSVNVDDRYHEEGQG